MTSIRETLAALLDPPRGVLVLDEYVEARVSGGLGRTRSVGDLARTVLSTPGLDAYVSGVLVTRDALAAVDPSMRALPGVRCGLLVGARMDPAAVRDIDGRDVQGPAEVHDILSKMRADRVSFVEWRAHVPPSEVGSGEVPVEARTLAVGAAVSQQLGLLPVLTFAMPDLATHSIAVSQAVTANALGALRQQLELVGADPGAILLRTNMVLPGELHAAQLSTEQIARTTVRVLQESIPAEVPGIIFLSSGQSLERACENLAAIAEVAAAQGVAWRLSFGFARPFATASLAAVEGDTDANVTQQALLDSCRRASEALGVATSSGSLVTELL